MEGKGKKCDEALRTFKKENSALLKQPIVQSFLKTEEHREIVRQAICCPTKQNRLIVDEAFQNFFKSVQTLSYLSNLLYYNSINFDKNRQKHKTRETLILDQPLQRNDDDGTTRKDMVYDPSPDTVDRITYETIGDYVEDKNLYRAIRTLTLKQQKILMHKYVDGLQNKEIASLFGDSPQNISKLHQRSLEKMRDFFQKEGNYHDSD